MVEVVVVRAAVALLSLDGVAKGVAQIEQGTLAAFQRVAFHDFGLVFATGGNGQSQCVGIARQQRRAFGFQPLEKAWVADCPVFDDFGQSRADFARRQAAQGGSVCEHGAGRVEGADQILPLGDIHRGLAAHRGIHHGKQGGRQLYAIDASHPASRGEAGQVADHAAAQREYAGVAGGAQDGQCFYCCAEVVQGL